MGQKPNLTRQFLVSFCVIVLVAGACFPFSEHIGYRSVSLILLLTVSFLAMRQHLYPVLFAAILSAGIWDFFFIPPRFTLHVNNSEDVLMLLMYFIVVLVNGVLSARVRFFEKIAREKAARARTLELYDTLFNALSHELRTPIATILGASDTLISPSANLGEAAKNSLSLEINRAAERLQRLTENLLNLSRLDTGAIRPKLDWCDLHELVHTVVNRLAGATKNHRVSVVLPENLPLVMLDFGLTEEVLHNLLLNAARHTPDATRIEILVKCTDNQLFMEVMDDGPGFLPEDLPLVFEKFYRSKNAPASGVGLGLSIVRGFVEAQGGTISLENRPGGGAHFTIKIPVETLFSTLPNA